MRSTATHGAHQPIWVGRLQQLQAGDSIAPQCESNAHDGVIDLVAARGIVSATTHWPRAAHMVVRDIVRRKLGSESFLGHVTTHEDPGTRQPVLSASSHAKEIVAAHAQHHHGLIGYIYEVEGPFEPTPNYGPNAHRSTTSVRVIGSTELFFSDIESYFGPGLIQLSDPLSHSKVEQDIRLTLNSGILLRRFS